MNEQVPSSEAERYSAEQRKMILAFARHEANPFQLLDHWLHGDPVRIGFASFKKPDLGSKAWSQLAELHRFSKAEITQLSNYAASIASLYLFEFLFSQDFGQSRFGTRLAHMIEDWNPAETPADVMVSEWAKSTHQVYSAWSDMRFAPCCTRAIMSVAQLAVRGFEDPAARKQAARSPKR